MFWSKNSGGKREFRFITFCQISDQMVEFFIKTELVNAEYWKFKTWVVRRRDYVFQNCIQTVHAEDIWQLHGVHEPTDKSCLEMSHWIVLAKASTSHHLNQSNFN